ncbi:MFS transporter [Hoeflea poritis]|uniref:MFS transporter n=1 Tax=Hoeflea poritis TaxID=2993659 RepID=A0ABT4VTM8_9HYPH|nr:MFS transporter [Hoeflea poritis]MDA4847402.1 MFS transporter [Hoeflea poritis]
MFGENRPWWLLGALSGVLGLTVLDETVVGVALPTIRSDLAMGQLASHWVVNAYLLTFTCFVAFGGRLGDALGHGRVFQAGAALFALASLAAGLAPTGGYLIAARALQGIGAAVIFPVSMAMVTVSFPPEKRGTAFGLQTTVGGIFMSSGPLIGGLFSQELSWRWIFLINLPIVLVIACVVLATWQSTDENNSKAGERFDTAGFATLLVGLVALVVFLMQGPEWGWTNPSVLMLLVIGLLLMIAFVFIELRRPDPLIELDLLAIRTFTGGTLSFFVFQFNKIVIFVFVAMFLQEKLGRTPVASGLAVMIAILPTLLTSLITGRLTDRLGARPPLMLGFAVNGAAVLLIGLLSTLENYWLVVLPLILWGASLPFASIPARRALMGAVPKPKHGQASGINLTIQMFGGTIGMALCGSILAATGSYQLVFMITGCLVLATVFVIWSMVERD